MKIAQKIEAEALALPVDARASLAQRLLLSLEEVSEADFDRLWGEESARRATRADAVASAPITAGEVGKRARALLR